MLLFGGKFNLTCDPGMGRDYFDDKVPSYQLEELTRAMQNPSPGFRPVLSNLNSKFSWQKSDDFYEGMLCGLAMVSSTINDLAQAHEVAQMIYSGLQCVIALHAGVVATKVVREGGQADGGGQEHPQGL